MSTSCKKDDDNDDQSSADWKALNDKRFTDSIADSKWIVLASQSGEGNVYWKKSTVMEDSDLGLRVTPNGTPEYTDTVQVRFEVWYYNTKNEKIIAASTENPSYYSLMANPNKVPYTVCVNRQVTSTSSSTQYYRYANSTSYSAIDLRTDGWSTLIQDMNVGDERLACISYRLGYNSTPQTYIPAYTMLWYRIKLLKIIPMVGRS